VSFELTRAGIEHAVLERGRVGHTWHVVAKRGLDPPEFADPEEAEVVASVGVGEVAAIVTQQIATSLGAR
jgi:hypothetical protein